MSTDYDRLKRMIDHDKETLNEPTRAAAIADFKRVAEEYFQTDGGFLLTARETPKGAEAVFTFRFTRVKNFKTLK